VDNRLALLLEQVVELVDERDLSVDLRQLVVEEGGDFAKERSKNNLRKFIAGLEKRWDSIDQLSQIVFETFLSMKSVAMMPGPSRKKTWLLNFDNDQ
jgi:predicted P-loop ATPase